MAISPPSQVRAAIGAEGKLPEDAKLADHMVATEVWSRARRSGQSNISRTVSDLVRAGFIPRHYQGYRVDHENRGAGREAVYTILPTIKKALGQRY